jgi:hypothetical protein
MRAERGVKTNGTQQQRTQPHPTLRGTRANVKLYLIENGGKIPVSNKSRFFLPKQDEKGKRQKGCLIKG